MTTTIRSLLAGNLALLVLAFSLISLPSFRTRDPSYVDGAWALGFILVALSTLARTDGDPTRSTLLVVLTSAWGVRLSSHLFSRWHRSGPDPRYQAMLERGGPGHVRLFLWSRVFLTQAVLIAVISLPVQLGQVYDHPAGLSLLNVLGAALAVLGIVLESVADHQLNRFKQSRTSHEQVLDTGLWRYSRHPNYFGEACTWWGLFGLGAVNAPTVAAALGPLVLTGFLLKWSGVGHLERALTQTKPAYEEYIARTSAFLPAPPRSARATDQR